MDEWNSNTFLMQEKTSVFSLRREFWFNGPELPDPLIATHNLNSDGYCATGLNRTSAIFIGIGKSLKSVYLYNFETNVWSQMSDTPIRIEWCNSYSSHGKDYRLQ